MIIQRMEIEKFRAFQNTSFALGKRITAIAGRNATQKTTLLGMLGQPFTISSNHPMHGCTTIDGYNFRSQFKEKFKISPKYDIIGQHKWTLILNYKVYNPGHYTIVSIARKQKGKPDELRFWNAESRAQGAGYIQIPVYFLSLSRLFPIGESGKTKTITLTLTEEELSYLIDNYRTILSIQQIGKNPAIGLEKGTASKTFAGVSDDTHDILTNSAGEGNITRIILAVLSFKRLREEYGKNYKGGILLIDELDATLYPFAQPKLVEYLWQAAKDYGIQIIFTTHSPIVLKAVNKYQLQERQERGINLPPFAYDSSIVYLEHIYDQEGRRIITAQNISTSSELARILNDISLTISTGKTGVRIYCEDKRAMSFLQHILTKKTGINLELYMSFVDINLGWTNYVQLVEKKVPEFQNNIIVLDGDVLTDPRCESKSETINSAGNFIFLPLTIEKDIFDLLKNYAAFSRFQDSFSTVSKLTYDVCFNNWPLETEKYTTDGFKQWYKHIEGILGNQTLLFDFWCAEFPNKVDEFVENFIRVFNSCAEKNEFDGLPVVAENDANEESPE